MRNFFFIAVLLATVASADEEFSFTVMDAFKISGGKVELVITGKVDTGAVNVGDKVCLHSKTSGTTELTVAAIEIFRKVTDSAKAGDMVGIGVNGLSKGDVGKGDSITASCND